MQDVFDRVEEGRRHRMTDYVSRLIERMHRDTAQEFDAQEEGMRIEEAYERLTRALRHVVRTAERVQIRFRLTDRHGGSDEEPPDAYVYEASRGAKQLQLILRPRARARLEFHLVLHGGSRKDEITLHYDAEADLASETIGRRGGPPAQGEKGLRLENLLRTFLAKN